MLNNATPAFHLQSSNTIQGDILVPFRKNLFNFLLIDYGFGSSENQAGREWVDEMLKLHLISTTDDVVRADGREETEKTIWTNLSFTFTGLTGIDPRFDQWIPPELAAFRAGGSSDRTVRELNDNPADRSKDCLLGDKADQVKAVIKVAAGNDNNLAMRTKQLTDIAKSHEINVQEVVAGKVASNAGHNIEIGFKFRDGVSQPAVIGMDAGGTIQAGQFVLGSPMESGTPSSGSTWMKDSSFMVLRKLQQHPDVWTNQLQAIATHLSSTFGRSVSPTEVAEMLIGRGQDGRELTNQQLFSHVHKMNQGAPGVSNLHRIIRRGVPYTNADGSEVGLLFNAYMSSIEQQFEFLQKVWANDPDKPDFSAGPDPIIGNVAEPFQARVVKDQRAPIQLNRVVTTRGSLYTFVPSMYILQNIAKGNALA